MQRPRCLATLERMWIDPPGAYRSGDEYDRDAITHVMACSSWLPGELL